MSIDSRTGIEAVLAIASIVLGVTGAALVEPIVLGIAAAGAVVATTMRLYDRSHNPGPASTERGKARIAI